MCAPNYHTVDGARHGISKKISVTTSCQNRALFMGHLIIMYFKKSDVQIVVCIATKRLYLRGPDRSCKGKPVIGSLNALAANRRP